MQRSAEAPESGCSVLAGRLSHSVPASSTTACAGVAGVAGSSEGGTEAEAEHDLRLKDECHLRSARRAQLQLQDGAGAGSSERETPTAKRQRVPDGPGLAPSNPQLPSYVGVEAGERRFACEQRCYICKELFTAVHHHYADLCPSCADSNFKKRSATVCMKGRVCLVTGARVKVGFHVCLMLLRMGARVIATTRFPDDALRRFMSEPDSAEWKLRLQVVALDFRFVGSVERFCSWLAEREAYLDVVINNAAQTIRRPAAYYRSLVEAETFRASASASASALHQSLPWVAGAPSTAPTASNESRLLAYGLASASLSLAPAASALDVSVSSDCGADPLMSALSRTAPQTAAEASQLRVLPEDEDESCFPDGELDAQGQQLDLRRKNSWKLKLGEVSSTEALEVFFVNVVAPFILNSRLLPLLRTSPHPDRYIVNVSAMEGKFNRSKTSFHPHTNMAKAALNMMTRTCAADLARNGSIFMTSVDTGWINDEHPLPDALRRAEQGFQTPLDEIDAAARVLDPVLSGVGFVSRGNPLPTPRRNQGEQRDPMLGPVWGVFLKDYESTDW